ncbi:MAG: RNA polymerase sigma factor [Phycisphaerae bacterium]
MAQSQTYDADMLAIEAIQAGDRYAFSDLVRRHDRWVKGVIYGVLGLQDMVEDVAQRVWTSAWHRIGELRDADRWRPWLYRLARNAAIDAGREATRRRSRFQALAGDLPEADAARRGRSDPELAERHQKVLDVVAALPALYREPFVLRHLSGWSYRQIAEVMEMPVDSVETRLVRARRMLREALQDKV